MSKDRVAIPSEEWLINPEVFRVNREDAHSDHYFYTERPEKYGQEMSLRQYLNGTWKYSYAKNPAERIKDFYKEDFDCSEFADIKVPGHIELQGYDKCQYINVMYPWEGHEDLRPPYIPTKHNPVSSYVTYFDVNEELLGKRTYISFQGVETAFYLWINGEFVGYSEDSFTPSEFDITDFIKEKDNKLAVEVYKRSSASWLEDQDFWRFSGIFRDVYLYAVPKTHVRDVFVKAGLDENYTDGELKVELEMMGELSGSVGLELVDKAGKTVMTKMGLAVKDKVEVAAVIKEVDKWSAELPNLYTLNISLYDTEGNLVEWIPQRIGFRTFEMKNKIMCINGKRIVFKGVNRHEFSCRNGRALTKREMEQDIKTIKSLNINAVRTCHYPNQSYWYELCDEYGVYLIDEANLETHGSWARNASKEEFIVPGSRPEWTAVVVDRAESMLERDKNHPSVLIWSCGNESHAGTCIFAMTEFFHKRNPERLVHYESCVHDRNFSAITDMESRMYAKPAEIEEYLKGNPDKPYLSCEYMHAMGNSCGGMFKYTDLEYKYEQYQGGFIWDYVDQALLVKDEKGKAEMMVGGDFKERPCDYYFCGNGILFADRKLSPKAQEVKYLYQNIKLYPTDKGVLIVNENLFESTDDYIFEIRLLKDGKAVWAGSFSSDVKAGEEEFIPISYPSMADKGEYVIECRAILLGYRVWAMPGHLAAWGQSKPIVVEVSDVAASEKANGYNTKDISALANMADVSAKAGKGLNVLNFNDFAQNQETKGSDYSSENMKAELETFNNISEQVTEGISEKNAIQKADAVLLENAAEKDYFDDVIMADNCIGVKTKNVHAIFSRGAGGLISYVSKGVELIEKVPRLTFWRAATDNDKGCRFPSKSSVWMGVTQFHDCVKTVVEYKLADGRILDGTVGCDEFILPKDDDNYGKGIKSRENAKLIEEVIITCKFKLYTVPETEAVIKYTMTPNGKINVRADYFAAEGLPKMPVFGVTFAMDKQFDRMEFYGRGPEENYNDRCMGARLGIFKTKVKDNVTPYLDPQECGNRHDVRWVKVTDEFKHGVHIEAVGKPFDMTVLPYTQMELQECYKINRLHESHVTVVSILGAAMGVGGDDSWGAPVYEEFTVNGDENQSVEFTFLGI